MDSLEKVFPDRNTQADSDLSCPYCGSEDGQVKAGLSQGTQRYRCKSCSRRYLRNRQERGHPPELREQAVRLHLQGRKDRQIARQLGISAPTVALWVRAAREAPLPPTIVPRNENAPGRERTTIADVARQANVSVTTVSNYLNNKGRMRAETRLRIAAAIERLDFAPNALVRAIKKRQTRILGVLLFGIGNLDDTGSGAITQELLAGINTAADHAEYDVLLYTGWPHRPTRASGRDFLNGNADGLLWVAPDIGEPALERVANAGLPVVSLLSRHVPDTVGFVNLDIFGAMNALVEHLVERGHRRIAYTGPIDASNYRDRRDGYRAALGIHGVAWDGGIEDVRTKPTWQERGDLSALERLYLPVVKRWTARHDPPTAIIAGDYTLAAGIIAALRRLGRRVPEEVSVCGFDDTPDSRSIAGGVTTIHQPFRQMGERAVERLLALIEGAPAQTCRVVVPGSLVVGATTARRR